MRRFLWLFLALGAADVSAREVSVSVYSAQQRTGFRLLVPGAEQDARGGAEAGSFGRPQLATDFADLAPNVLREASAPEPAPNAGNSIEFLHVPAWMRGKTIAFGRYYEPSLSSATSIGCPRAVYRPYPGLGRLAEARRRQYFGHMAVAACEAGVPVDLFDSLVVQESRYDPTARSSKGAIGLAQLMPGTARELGVVNAWDVHQNLRGGARYLGAQLREFGEWRLALSAYNAGPGAVRRYRGIPPYRETEAYVRTILSNVREHLKVTPVAAQQPAFRRASLSVF